MARKGASYRVVWRNAKGHFSEPRYARTFEIFYGKRKVLARTEIPKNKRKVVERERIVKRFVKAIELKRLEILERARVKRAKVREARRREERRREVEIQTREFAEREEERRLEEAKSPLPPDWTLDEFMYFREVRGGVLDFNNMRSEPPTTLKAATVSDVLIIPVIPDGSIYRRETINKSITYGEYGGTRDLSIMNVDLNEDHFVLLDQETIESAYLEVYEKLFPIVHDYWVNTRESSDSYIFRLKFAYEHDMEEWGGHGISLGVSRQEIADVHQLIRIFQQTYMRLLGDEFLEIRVDGKIKSRGARNYLKDNAVVFITGCTLEAASSR